MTRKKVKLVWIVNDAARKASLKKRRLGLLKKVQELSILCGVNAFIIIYSPDDPEPAVWPPTQSEVVELLARFEAMPEIERCKKMMNQETYMRERMGKAEDQGRKGNKKNRDIEIGYLMFRAHHADDLDLAEMHALAWLVEEKIKDIRKRAEYFQQAPPFLPQQQGEQMGTAVAVAGEGNFAGGPHAAAEGMGWDQWFTDMMNSTDNFAGGSSSTRSDIGLPQQQPPPFGPAGIDYGMHGMGAGSGMGMPHANYMGGYVPGLQPPSSFPGVDPSRSALGFPLPPPPPPPPGNIGGNYPAGNAHLGGTDGAGRSDMGPPGFFGGPSDHMGPPYDPNQNWP